MVGLKKKKGRVSECWTGLGWAGWCGCDVWCCGVVGRVIAVGKGERQGRESLLMVRRRG
jgi:hypothetical protein